MGKYKITNNRIKERKLGKINWHPCAQYFLMFMNCNPWGKWGFINTSHVQYKIVDAQNLSTRNMWKTLKQYRM